MCLENLGWVRYRFKVIGMLSIYRRECRKKEKGFRIWFRGYVRIRWRKIDSKGFLEVVGRWIGGKLRDSGVRVVKRGML